MPASSHITVLGGGPAGLAVGYYAGKRGLDFDIYEAGPRVGGNCRTLSWGDFRFDSGAHRLHDRDPEVTRELMGLLGDELRRIDVPSQIWDEGRLIEFPLTPVNLLRHLGLASFAAAGLDVLRARLAGVAADPSFEDFAVRRYGRTVAARFLLNYSQKLWGEAPARLSPGVAGKRLSGLGLRSFIAESLLGRRASTSHVEGVFYYPRSGIGAIPEGLARACGGDHIHLSSPVSGVRHDGSKIREIMIDGGGPVEVAAVASTLPLGLLLRILDPPPPPEVLALAGQIRYRQVRLVVLFLDRESVTDAATVYFPSLDYHFTRVAEPRNRSLEMAPPGKTSLVAEIPCQEEDETWLLDDDELIAVVSRQLLEVGWFTEREILGATVARLKNAYPILDRDCGARVEAITAHLSRFENLHLTGRSGRFVYGWIHDMMRFGDETVEAIASGTRR